MKTLFKYPLFYCLLGIASAAFFEEVRRDFWVGAFALGGLILLYSFFVMQEQGGERLRASDNCYFIGFVYTLSVIALSVGLDSAVLLSDYSNANSEEVAGPRQLLETIGIALATSVIGMIFRFMLAHNIEIPEDEFDGIVSRATLAANRLEGAVSTMARSVKYYRESMETATDAMKKYEEGLVVHVDNIGSEGERVGKRLDKIADELVQGFGERFADMLQKGHFDAAREDMEEAASRYRESAAVMARALSESATQLNEFNSSITKNIDMPNRIVDATTETMQTMQQEISKGFADINDVVERTMNALQSAMDNNKWENLEKNAADLSAHLETMNDKLQKIEARQEEVLNIATLDAERLRTIRDNFSTLLEDIKNDTETVTNIKEEYRRKFEEAAESALTETHQLYGKLIGGASVALSQLDNLKQLSNSLEKIAGHLEDKESKDKS